MATIIHFVNLNKIKGFPKVVVELPFLQSSQIMNRSEHVSNECRDLVLYHQPVPISQIPLLEIDDDTSSSSDDQEDNIEKYPYINEYNDLITSDEEFDAQIKSTTEK